MSLELEFPIPLFDFLTSVSVATEEAGRYVSGSASRRGGAMATWEVALEHYRRSQLLGETGERIEIRNIMEALRAWSWAFHLERPGDILRTLARTGKVFESDLGHAASMIRECNNRYSNPYHDFRFIGQLPLCLPSDKVEEALSTETGEAYLWQQLQYALSGALSELMARSHDFGFFSLVIFDVRGASTLPTDPHSMEILRLTSFFRALIENAREVDLCSVRAAGRLSPTRLAIITGHHDKKVAKEFCENLIHDFPAAERPVDTTGTPFPISAGITDFFDYPKYIHIIEGTRKLPRRPPDFTPISPDLRSPKPDPLLLQALSALHQARLSDGDWVAVYRPPAKEVQLHQRTPESSKS